MSEQLYNGFSSGNRRKAKSDRDTKILAIAFIIGGLVMLGYGVFCIYNGYKSRTWPQALGTINASYAERQLRRESETHNSRIKYVARIRYAYTVNGRKYNNDEVGFGKSEYTSRRKSKIEKYLEQFPVGKSVRVFYNPENPGQAVLSQGVTGGALLVLAGGILFLLIASSMFYVLRNNGRNTRYQNQSCIEASRWG